jgi:hypothetical protein
LLLTIDEPVYENRQKEQEAREADSQNLKDVQIFEYAFHPWSGLLKTPSLSKTIETALAFCAATTVLRFQGRGELGRHPRKFRSRPAKCVTGIQAPNTSVAGMGLYFSNTSCYVVLGRYPQPHQTPLLQMLDAELSTRNTSFGVYFNRFQSQSQSVRFVKEFGLYPDSSRLTPCQRSLKISQKRSN